MTIKRTSLLALTASLALITACSGGPNHFSNSAPQLVAAPDSVSAMLAESANRASTALETLAAVESSKAPDIAVAPIGNAPPELRRAVTVNWIGPVEPVAKTLASRAGYSFMTLGSPPPVPVVVSLNVENMPVIEILRDLGLQLGMRGDVRVDSARKVVEIHYAPNTGVGR